MKIIQASLHHEPFGIILHREPMVMGKTAEILPSTWTLNPIPTLSSLSNTILEIEIVVHQISTSRMRPPDLAREPYPYLPASQLFGDDRWQITLACAITIKQGLLQSRPPPCRPICRSYIKIPPCNTQFEIHLNVSCIKCSNLAIVLTIAQYLAITIKNKHL